MGNTLRFIVALVVMAGVTYLIRLLPLVFVKQKITSPFLRSFLYYAPYTVLTTIAFPTILYTTGNLISGIVTVTVCVFLAYKNRGLMTVGFGGVFAALITEVILLLVSK